MPKLTQSQLDRIRRILEYLEASRNFFNSRDSMNAAIHLQGIRYSPITEEAIKVTEMFRGLMQELNS